MGIALEVSSALCARKQKNLQKSLTLPHPAVNMLATCTVTGPFQVRLPDNLPFLPYWKTLTLVWELSNTLMYTSKLWGYSRLRPPRCPHYAPKTSERSETG